MSAQNVKATHVSACESNTCPPRLYSDSNALGSQKWQQPPAVP